MNLKNNFLQAAQELMGKDSDDMGTTSTETQSSTAPEAAAPAVAAPPAPPAPAPSYSAPVPPPVQQPAPVITRRPDPEPISLDYAVSDPDTTIIAAGTQVIGNIISDGAVELMGLMKGDLISKSDVTLCGKLQGNAAGSNVSLHGCMMTGDLSADRDITMDGESMVVGNISAQEMSFNGKVKGDLEIRGALVVQERAILLGNASADSISIREGAAIHGKVHITSADLADIFPDEPASSARQEAPRREEYRREEVRTEELPSRRTITRRTDSRRDDESPENL